MNPVVSKVIDHHEEVTAGCSVTYYQNGIIAMRVSSNDHDSIDGWTQHSINIRQAQPADSMLYILMDLADFNQPLTPYIRKRAMEVLRTRRDLKTHVAMVVSRSPLATLFVTFSGTLNALNPTGQMFFHYTFDEAWRWLVGVMEQHKLRQSQT